MTEEFQPNIHLALVHFPVYNKAGQIVVTSVTTLDVHDVARICRTYGLDSFHVVTPLKTQQDLIGRLIRHWVTGHGAVYNPTRKEALLKTRVKNSLQDVISELADLYGEKPRTVITDAGKFPQSIGFDEMRSKLQGGEPYLLVFGTGWGLEKGLLSRADYVLNPIEGLDGYNHLPVRAAIAIILDRLLAPTRGA
ncbi:MAG: RNA methyltransferase [Nitrospinaceae bacterium]